MRIGVLVVVGATLLWLGALLWLTPLALFFSFPWLAATAWLVSRVGWTAFSADNGQDCESQAKRLRSFGAQ